MKDHSPTPPLYPVGADSQVAGSGAAERRPSAEEILTSIGDGVLVLGLDWHVTYANAAAEKVLGKTGGSLLGNDVSGIFPRAATASIQRAFEEVVARRETAKFEYRTEDQLHVYQLTAWPSAVGVTVTFSDITELAASRVAHEGIEGRFRLAAANRTITLYEQDLALRYTWLYPLHQEHSHALGQTDEELSRPRNSSAELVEFKREVINSGIEQRREFKLQLPAGVRYYDVFVSPRRDAAGTIIGVGGAAFDITQRKQVEEELRLLYRFMAAVNGAAAAQEIYEAALDALCLSQGTERSAILLWNDADVMRFVASRGLTPEYRQAVEGHSPWSKDERHATPVCIDNVHTSQLSESLRAIIAREGIASVAFIPLQGEGRLLGKFMIYYAEPHHFTTQQLQVCETIAQQVGVAIQRQRAAQALEALVAIRTASLQEAIHQMEEFSYTVSHDLRSPLRAMIAYSETLLEDYQGKLDGEITQFLQRILKSAHRMDVLVRDTLAYSRVARRDLALSKISLDQVIQEVLGSLNHLVLEKSVVHVAAPLGFVIGNDALLVQAVSNLVANALKFVPPKVHPKVSISSTIVSDRVRLLISDNGIGIPPRYQARLFNIFERLNPNAGYEGTGIGLAIVRKAVERMAGNVGVISDGVEGSTFWIELPAEPS